MSGSSDCIACGLGDFLPYVMARDRMFDGQEKFLYLRCCRCGMLRQQSVLTESQAKRFYPSRGYYSYQKRDQMGLFDRVRQYLLKRYYAPTLLSRALTMIMPNVPAIPRFVRRGSVLDLGCGAGDTLIDLKALGWDVYGLDIDRSGVKVAKQRGLTNVSLGSFREMKKFPDHFFDAIRLYHVIEHLNDPELCLSLIRKKLKPGGELVMGTPNANSLVARIFGSYWYNLDAPRHTYVYTPEALSKMLTRFGLKPSVCAFYSAGGIVGSLQYLIRDRLPFRSVDLLSHAWLVMLVYPFEWLLDKIRAGDIFVIRSGMKHI